MSESGRENSIGALWFFSAIVLVALFVSAAVQGELTIGHIFLAMVILGLAVTGTLFMGEERVKAKRQRIDTLLSDMSPEERRELKNRLSNEEFLEESVLDHIGDDGELVYRS